VVRDDELLREVAGLCEYPVILAGRIDARFMDLPAEVMQVSMRVNQRYFATRRIDGGAAPFFIFAANIDAVDHGAAIIAGNERVLRARFSDARHFWDLDRRAKLVSRVAALDGVTFHAKLGTQGARARRISRLADQIAFLIGADRAQAVRAGLLSKADLTTGMVGEFPELQGVMGGYYARHDGEDDAVADAVRDHYLPRGMGDEVPVAPVSIAVALADKFDQLCGFFAVGEKPSGSGDPYALRRAALGIIRIIRENALRVGLLEIIESALGFFEGGIAAFDHDAVRDEIFDFFRERLRVQLRGEGERHDVLSAVLQAGRKDEDLVRILARTEAVAGFLQTVDGANLLAAYKRASNILRIEDKKDGPHGADVISRADLVETFELELDAEIRETGSIGELLEAEKFGEAMALLAQLRAPLDAFFTNVTVNAEAPVLRRNRLGLLAAIKGKMNEIADFGAIEG